ncbi:MAG: hypothetical protein JWM56_726 [Candidatus Peribacteria bacterium]|nr:hypothetical protein [Candidatus Peribacteria bacterium]
MFPSLNWHRQSRKQASPAEEIAAPVQKKSNPVAGFCSGIKKSISSLFGAKALETAPAPAYPTQLISIPLTRTYAGEVKITNPVPVPASIRMSHSVTPTFKPKVPYQYKTEDPSPDEESAYTIRIQKPHIVSLEESKDNNGYTMNIIAARKASAISINQKAEIEALASDTARQIWRIAA